MRLAEHHLLLGAIDRAPGADAALERPPDSGIEIRVAAQRGIVTDMSLLSKVLSGLRAL